MLRREIMLEKDIEKKLIKEVNKLGGLALKFLSPGYAGVPDRLILLPYRKLAFIELKAPGKTLRPLQEKRKRQLEELGFLVFCLDSKDEIGGVLGEIQSS
jgi:hypothetical protein